MPTRPRRCALAALLSLTAACSSTGDIDVSDRSSFAYGGQVRVIPGPIGIEVHGSRTEGEETLDHTDGTISWQGATFPSPAELDAEWSLTSAGVGAAFSPTRGSETQDLALVVGLRYTEVDFSLEGVQGDVDRPTLFFAVDYTGWIQGYTGFFVRGLVASTAPLEGAGFLDEDEEELHEAQIELGVAWRLGPGAIRLGWRTSDTRFDLPGSSDLRLENVGPFVSLALSF